MKHPAIFFAAGLLLGTATASAQITFRLGIRGGLSQARMQQEAATT